MIYTGAMFFVFAVLPAHRQNAAVATINDLGGYVVYDHQVPIGGGCPLPSAPPPGPAWLRRIVGDDYFRRVNTVALHEGNFSDPQNIDAALAAVARLPRCDLLRIHSHSGLQPRHLEAIAKLQNLKTLNLAGDCLNGQTLSSLAPLQHLQTLGLTGPIADSDMNVLEPLKALERFGCNFDTRVQRALGETTELDCENMDVDDAIRYLADRHEIKTRIERDIIADAGLHLYEIFVTEQVNGMTLQALLDRFLAPHKLGYRVDGNELVITTRAEVERAHAGVDRLKQKLPNLTDVTVGW